MYRFLYVEDNLTDMYLFDQMVKESHGPQMCTLTHAKTLAEGLALLESAPFDGVMMDLTLEDSRGLATLDAIVAAFPKMPVIVLTSSDNDALGIGALERGAQDYLVKDDVNLGTLERAVRYSIERKRLIEELRGRNMALERALAEVKRLQGLIRICAVCKRVVNENGAWQAIESYVHDHSDADFTHGYCPDCAREIEHDMAIRKSQPT